MPLIAVITGTRLLRNAANGRDRLGVESTTSSSSGLPMSPPGTNTSPVPVRTSAASSGSSVASATARANTPGTSDGGPVNDSPDAAPREPVTPEVVDGSMPIGGNGAELGQVDEQVTRPTKLIRIASMVRTMLEEVRRAPLDDAGRRRL